MNRDRRATVRVLCNLIRAYTGERSIPPRVLMALRDEVRELALTEERSVKKMEGFKDNDSTRANYLAAVAAHEDLAAAQEALEEQELEEALALLVIVADPASTDVNPKSARQAPRKAPRKKARA